MKKSLFFLAFLLFSLLSCKQIVSGESESQEAISGQTSGAAVFLNGRIVCSGELDQTVSQSPSIISIFSSQSNSADSSTSAESTRTAFPTKPTGYTLKVSAKNSASAATVEGTVESQDYRIELSPGSWTVTGEASDSDGKVILKKSVALTISNEMKSQDLELNYYKDSTVTGSIALPLAWDSTTGINRLVVSKNGSDLPAIDLSGLSTYTYSESNVSPGSSRLVFKFYKDDELLYICDEMVNVYSNMTTDSFYGSSYVSGKKINVTQDLIDALAISEIYVNSSGSDSNNGSYFAPVKTFSKALALVNESPLTNLSIHVQSNASMTEACSIPTGKTVKILGENASSLYKLSGASFALESRATSLTVKNVNFDGFGGITIAAGTAEIENSKITGGTSSISGGGIKVNSGTSLTGTSLIVSGCRAEIQGGGIFSQGTLKLNKCEISGCSSGSTTSGYAGGLYVAGGSATLKGCTIGNSNSSFSGGGIYIGASGSCQILDYEDDDGTITHSRILQNTSANNSARSAGIYNAGTLDAEKAEFTGNAGNAIYTIGTTTLTGCSFSENTPYGIYMTTKSITLGGSTKISDGIYIAKNTINVITDSTFALANAGEKIALTPNIGSGADQFVLGDTIIDGSASGMSDDDLSAWFTLSDEIDHAAYKIKYESSGNLGILGQTTADGTINVDDPSDNLTISVNSTSVSAGSLTVSVSATDENGDAIASSEITWSLTLCYANEETGTTSNTNSITFESAYPAGIYTLEVSARYGGLTYTSTFDITKE